MIDKSINILYNTNNSLVIFISKHLDKLNFIKDVVLWKKRKMKSFYLKTKE